MISSHALSTGLSHPSGSYYLKILAHALSPTLCHHYAAKAPLSEEAKNEALHAIKNTGQTTASQVHRH
ncbi:MAG: hypothetical protein HYV35_00990 [Lentisphaerae bacterium]|nr:hypothetical protein [Lentisphaerota bacterium]